MDGESQGDKVRGQRCFELFIPIVNLSGENSMIYPQISVDFFFNLQKSADIFPVIYSHDWYKAITLHNQVILKHQALLQSRHNGIYICTEHANKTLGTTAC